MLGLVLLYVGAVLFINALAMLGHIAPKEAAIMNLLTGGLSLFVSLHQVVSGDPALVRAAAFGLLFSFTYLWVAYVNLTGLDGRGLGWFSLFVAATASWVTVDALAAARTVGEYWMAGNWAAWTLLWLCFFVLGVLKRPALTKPVAWLTLVQSIVTAWVPGYLMLSGRLS
ncbi:MAG: AmiS/UreI family transporter [Rhodoferax sp.]|nr:AmiS/UreI family transporter [Rhodoferax sp.]MBP7492119.1 AmiS/UreI family transporter [Rhodoferax sp.]